ncbi:hypothetical protein [Curtobacterium sp. MCSS17_007]|uniref:hypothetical protein n=1 Tax=Curtobacterium sp. MCSS17_007 TaxID=2175646 RepID=UPI000DA8D108|nr:hypothetical protein [Curtobacterium sp. MCSS17_007]WIE76545.1 hypothetical protein DEJ22_004575 [Curtobacterium sp. MCSS17_007]
METSDVLAAAALAVAIGTPVVQGLVGRSRRGKLWVRAAEERQFVFFLGGRRPGSNLTYLDVTVVAPQSDAVADIDIELEPEPPRWAVEERTTLEGVHLRSREDSEFRIRINVGDGEGLDERRRVRAVVRRRGYRAVRSDWVELRPDEPLTSDEAGDVDDADGVGVAGGVLDGDGQTA